MTQIAFDRLLMQNVIWPMQTALASIEEKRTPKRYRKLAETMHTLIRRC